MTAVHPAPKPGRQNSQIRKRQVLRHRNALKSGGKNTGLLAGCPFQPTQPPPADTPQISGPLRPQKAATGMIRTAFDQGVELSAIVGLRRLFPGITDNAQTRCWMGHNIFANEGCWRPSRLRQSSRLSHHCKPARGAAIGKRSASAVPNRIVRSAVLAHQSGGKLHEARAHTKCGTGNRHPRYCGFVSDPAVAQQVTSRQIEPTAGGWRTWSIASGSAVSVAAPPRKIG